MSAGVDPAQLGTQFADSALSVVHDQNRDSAVRQRVDRRSKRAALYIRVSSRDQRPDLQLDELRTLAAQRGWTIAGEYVDLAQSSVKDRRPELDRLITQVHRGRLDVVVCWRFDRFARSVRHLVLALDDFRARGVDFLSLRDAIDTSTPAGRFTFHVIAAVAELERELIRERTRSGIAAAKRRGAKVGRPRTHVHLAEVLRLRARGWSLRRIARRLGVPDTTLRRALTATNESAPKKSPDLLPRNA